MTLSREDRLPSDQLSEYSLKEYERLQQDAPPLGGAPIKLYKEKFKNSPQAVPDACEETFEIKIYGSLGTSRTELGTSRTELGTSRTELGTSIVQGEVSNSDQNVEIELN